MYYILLVNVILLCLRLYVYIDIYTLQLCIIDLTQRGWHTLRFTLALPLHLPLKLSLPNSFIPIKSLLWTRICRPLTYYNQFLKPVPTLVFYLLLDFQNLMFIGRCNIVIVEEQKTNLMSLAILFHFLCAQHVSDINISIIKRLRLFCWITTLVVLFCKDGGFSISVNYGM